MLKVDTSISDTWIASSNLRRRFDDPLVIKISNWLSDVVVIDHLPSEFVVVELPAVVVLFFSYAWTVAPTIGSPLSSYRNPTWWMSEI